MKTNVSFRTVSPYNTSVTCPKCGLADKKNRDEEAPVEEDLDREEENEDTEDTEDQE